MFTFDPNHLLFDLKKDNWFPSGEEDFGTVWRSTFIPAGVPQNFFELSKLMEIERSTKRSYENKEEILMHN